MNNLTLGRRNFIETTPIKAGGGGDKMYRAKTKDGEDFLLRLCDLKMYGQKKAEFELMKKLSVLDIGMPQPIDFGIYDDTVYILTSWINGVGLKTVFRSLPTAAQYLLGVKAGENLRKIHSLTVSEDKSWEDVFEPDIEKVIRRYKHCNLDVKGIEQIFLFIEKNKSLLKNRPQCYLHGDYADYNMMLEEKKLMIIDFSGVYQIGDPWHDFYRIIERSSSSWFATGVVKGYFGSAPPKTFWSLSTLYMCIDALRLTTLRHTHAPHRLELSMNRIANILKWHSDMKVDQPKWYQCDYL